jgi:hypothetical protein
MQLCLSVFSKEFLQVHGLHPSRKNVMYLFVTLWDHECPDDVVIVLEGE